MRHKDCTLHTSSYIITMIHTMWIHLVQQGNGLSSLTAFLNLVLYLTKLVYICLLTKTLYIFSVCLPFKIDACEPQRKGQVKEQLGGVLWLPWDLAHGRQRGNGEDLQTGQQEDGECYLFNLWCQLMRWKKVKDNNDPLEADAETWFNNLKLNLTKSYDPNQLIMTV